MSCFRRSIYCQGLASIQSVTFISSTSIILGGSCFFTSPNRISIIYTSFGNSLSYWDAGVIHSLKNYRFIRYSNFSKCEAFNQHSGLGLFFGNIYFSFNIVHHSFIRYPALASPFYAQFSYFQHLEKILFLKSLFLDISSLFHLRNPPIVFNFKYSPDITFISCSFSYSLYSHYSINFTGSGILEFKNSYNFNSYVTKGLIQTQNLAPYVLGKPIGYHS